MEPCLFGFDVNSHFARNYSMHTKNGEPSGPNTHDSDGNPIYSLRPTLQSVLKEMRQVNEMGIQHTHMVAVFDHPGKNFRHELFSDYKGNRPPKPASWSSQESMLFDYFKSNGIPCLRQEGVEADDVLGTLATILEGKGVNVVLFTGDKDIMSLCSPLVRVYSGREKKLYEQRDVEARFKVPCSRVLDYLAMLGDSADNVSGIEGLGGKTAPRVASQVSLEELVANPEPILSGLKIRGASKIAAWITNNKERVLLSQKLIALKTDVKLGANMKDFQYPQPQQ
jgi:DNA polymerase-1